MNGPLWKADEVSLLRQNTHLSHSEVHNLFVNQGFSRSRQSIVSKRRKMGWFAKIERDEFNSGYTALGLGRLLGVNSNVIERWVRFGYLKSRRESGEARGSKHRISQKALRRFLVDYIHLWEPGKADKFWLIDVLKNTS